MSLSSSVQKCEASPLPHVGLHREQPEIRNLREVFTWCRITVYLGEARMRAFVCNLDLILTCSNTGFTKEPDPLQLCSSRRRVHRIQVLQDLHCRSQSVERQKGRKKDGGRCCWLSSGWLNTEACWARKFLWRRQLLLSETAPHSAARWDPGPAEHRLCPVTEKSQVWCQASLCTGKITPADRFLSLMSNRKSRLCCVFVFCFIWTQTADLQAGPD